MANLVFGDITDDSSLIFQEFFEQSGSDGKIAVRTENINTSEKISAVRGTDVSGQNGLASITAITDRYVQIAFASDGIGKGFNFRIDIYSKQVKDSPVGSKQKCCSFL